MLQRSVFASWCAFDSKAYVYACCAVCVMIVQFQACPGHYLSYVLYVHFDVTRVSISNGFKLSKSSSNYQHALIQVFPIYSTQRQTNDSILRRPTPSSAPCRFQPSNSASSSAYAVLSVPMPIDTDPSRTTFQLCKPDPVVV